MCRILTEVCRIARPGIVQALPAHATMERHEDRVSRIACLADWLFVGFVARVVAELARSLLSEYRCTLGHADQTRRHYRAGKPHGRQLVPSVSRCRYAIVGEDEQRAPRDARTSQPQLTRHRQQLCREHSKLRSRE